jgi:hypothetical protein
MNDEPFLAAFENGTLNPFHHSDHVRMAFLYLRRYAALEALQRFSTALARFAAANGQPERYHETITWGYLFLIRERMARAGGEVTWERFSEVNDDLLDWKESVLMKYYRPETLASELARRTFLLPDLTGRDS